MSWVSAIPDVLVCVGLFFAPGLLATYLGGLRGITAWAMAPLMTVAAVAVVAVAGGFLNFRFGLWPAAAGILVMACLAAAMSLLLRRRKVERPPRDPRGYSLAVLIGAVAAALVGIATFISGVRRPDAFSESYDAVYHYNAVRYIEQTGKASPLTIGSLGQPGSHGTFYPDVWHLMAALLVRLTGASIPVASTVTCLVVAVLIWPLSCLLLARHLFGASGNRAMAAVVITGLLSSLFGEFPWNITGWGVLWPNALGMALAPAGVALGLSITRLSVGDTFGAVRQWCFGVVAAWAIAIAHPDSALSVALVCLFPVLLVVVPYVLDQWRTRTLATTLVLLAILAVVIAGLAVASSIGIVQSTVGHFFPRIESPRHALAGAFSNGTDHMAPEWLLAGFTFLGAVACFVWRERRWLVFTELVIAVLYVGSAATESRLSKLLTGLWYNDSHRIAAILPVVAIPLATTGVLFAAELLSRAMPRVADVANPAVSVGLPLAIGTVVALATVGYSLPANASALGTLFSTSGAIWFDSPTKLQFLQKVARLVPDDALVADDPFAGSAYLFALSGDRVLFPQVAVTSNNKDMAYLAHHLVNVSHDPHACALVRHYDVGYMVVVPDDYLRKRQLPGWYNGVAYPAPHSGFQLMAADGLYRLYKITMCQSPSQPGASVEAAGQSSG